MKTSYALLAILFVLAGREISNSQNSQTAPANTFTSTIIPIKYASADNVAHSLNSLSADGDGDTNRMLRFFKRLGLPADLPALGRFVVTADARSNYISVSASASDMTAIEGLLAKIDAVVPQIFVEAVIMELPWPNRGRFKRNSPGRTPAELFAEIGLTNTQVISTVEFAPVASTSTPFNHNRGFRYVARTYQDFDSILTAADSSSRIILLQKVRILTANNEAATLFFGLGYLDRIGAVLEMTPLIHRDGLVEFHVRQTVEEVTGSVNIIGVGEVPSTTSTSSRATFQLHDRESLIIGGVLRVTEHQWSEETPIIRNMPKLKNLLRPLIYRTRSEIVVLLRPTVLPASNTGLSSH